MIEDKSKIHFVLVAGFSSDDQEVWSIRDALREKGYGATSVSFYGPELRYDFSDLREEDCQKNLKKSISDLSREYDKVYGIGISLGGALLLEYAKENSNIDGIVSIGTPFRLKNRSIINIGRKLILPVAYPLWKELQKVKSLRLWPLGALGMMLDYLDGKFLSGLEKISAPILFMHSRKDGVTDYRALDEYLPRISSLKKEVIFFRNGDHVISYTPMIADEAIRFFNLSDKEAVENPDLPEMKNSETMLEFEKVEYN